MKNVSGGSVDYHDRPDRSHCFIDEPFHNWVTYTRKVEIRIVDPARGQ